MLSWVHFGDLHATDEDGWRSLDDLQALIADANRHLGGAVDFAFLPGDNANHGEPAQYQRIADALQVLELRWFALAGDHDFEPGSLRNFHEGLGAEAPPVGMLIQGRRCLFLDIVSAGRGGPDFRLGADQRAWLEAQLALAQDDAERPVVFMHAFPGDLAEDAELIGRLFADARVACVDTGHTHYNELLNDGRVIYAATRSTGQVEEGPVGFSIHAVDGSVVSWRFKERRRPWPMALITSPADRRLVTDPTLRDQIPGPRFTVRAKVFGEGVIEVSLAIGGRAPAPMARLEDEPSVWSGEAAGLSDGVHSVRVEALDAKGAKDADSIEVLVAQTPPTERPAIRDKLGHDLHSLGAWPARGLLGSQLGPNKHGRAW